MKVLWNDQIVAREAVKLDIEDRGYQFGDGLYEAVRVYKGDMFMFDEHFDRLERCAKKIRLTLPFTRIELQTQLYRLISAEQISNGAVYFQVTRGIDSPRDHRIPDFSAVKPVVTGNVSAYERPQAMQQDGLSATVIPDERWLHCDIKSLSLLGNVLSLDAAMQKGYGDALLVRDGYFTEASASNLWFVFGDTYYTHPDGNLVLPGVTKLHLLNLMRQNGLKIKEEAVPAEKLATADEIFISNSIWEVVPIVNVDGNPVGAGKIGPLTKLIQDKYIASTKSKLG
ncbi:D-amino acid aminotransferase [Agrilactobacillus composti DSM 18527 = JCM 14202]|uniref:D-alanine aminotransferase n=1 Tax=Agrilactobacillus composti DSM 18527 = JCM 14202 TaxID=1423734 RepID=X0PLV1_9LACO|nr:D-amino-acid transaminase [Agrilactobacillus composti]KRM30509.1 D-amino acid aminotransferase [Agrilactobacillus composti DSM 18527 = JCM 14202]GAF38432.1 D-alanine aminotransferase [Agrilactobacillus composti DSM 18527 = JCM 14202]